MEVQQFLVTLPDGECVTVFCRDGRRLSMCVADTDTTYVLARQDAELEDRVMHLDTHRGWKDLRLAALEAEIKMFQLPPKRRAAVRERNTQRRMEQANAIVTISSRRGDAVGVEFCICG